MADYAKLAGLIKQPRFASLTDAEASAIFDVEDIPVAKWSVESAQIYQAVEDSVAKDMLPSAQRRLAEIYSLTGEISLNDSRASRVLLELFPLDSPTQIALAALQPPPTSLAQKEGLVGRTRESDVFKARVLLTRTTS